jgi:hypothetical protein
LLACVGPKGGVGPKSGVSIHEWNLGFEHLARLNQLLELDLKQSGVKDSGLRRLCEYGACSGLERLTISFCALSLNATTTEWQGFQVFGPWRDSYLDGLVDRLNRANAFVLGEEEGEEGILEAWFSLQCINLTATAYTRKEGSAKPGPNVR